MIGSYAPKFTPEDVHIGNLFGALEAIDSGVTTLMDWSHITNTPDHADAAIAGLRESRVRAVYGYGSPVMPAAPWWADNFRRLAKEQFGDPEALVTLALASSGPEIESYEQGLADIQLGRQEGVRITMHVGIGPMGQARVITRMHEDGILGDDLIFVHGNTLTDVELQAIAATGGHVSVSPRIEMHMGHGDPATGRMIAAGIKPSVSLDVVSGVGGNLFADLRTALEAEHASQNRAALARGEWGGSLVFTVADAIRMATIDGARALGLEDKVGSLTPGKRADLIVVDPDFKEFAPTNHVEATISLTEPVNVRHVFIDGVMVKENGNLTGHDLMYVRGLAAASHESLTAPELVTV